MSRVFCPNCETFVEAVYRTEKEVYTVRREPIQVDAEVAFCETCGASIFDEERDSRNLKRAYDHYRENHNLLEVDRIRSLRESYGLSQRALSRLLGWGEVTVHRYENGAVQDKAHDTTLRLLEDPANMRRLLETNRGRLPSAIAARLAENVEQHLQEDNERAFEVSFERYVSHGHVDITSGFREFDLEKFKSMVLYLIRDLGGVLKTKLNKLTWYCDCLHFKEMSVSITGTRYVCLPYGPVPDNYELIIANMIHEGLIDKSEIVFDTTRGIVGEQFAVLANPDAALFTEMEITVMDTVVSTFRGHSATAIADRSHQEIAYKKFSDGDMSSYECAGVLSLSVS